MNKKLILTEQQHVAILNEILRETIKKIESNERLDENFWDSVKYGLSKLGRYKAGGKIFGKGQVDQESMAKIKAIIEKEGNELIRNLDAEIRKGNPEFPNNKDPQQFLTTVIEIAAVYDSIVGATKKEAGSEGYIPIDAANGIITDLREYTKKYLDVDLAAVYSGFDENENLMNEEYELNTEQLNKVDEHFGLREVEPEAAPADAGAPANPDLDAGDVRSQLQAKRGGGEDFSSTRMDTLKSNKLPMVLAGAGAALGSLGWMAQTEWFKHWIESILGADKILQTPAITQDITGGAPDARGFVHWCGDIGGKPIQTGADLQGFINKFGAENVSHMFDANGAGDSMGQMQKLQQLINSNPSASVGDLFNKANQTFGSMHGGQNLFGVSSSAKFFSTIIVKQATSTIVKGAGTAVAGQLVGLGPVLAGIGVGLILTGAVVKLIRVKGQKSSRAATLNALYQSIRGLEGGMGLIPASEVDMAGEAPTGGAETGGGDAGTGIGGPEAGGQAAAKAAGKAGGGNEDLYNSLKGLFQFIVNNKNTMGTKSEFGTGTSGKSAQAPLTEGKYIKDKRVLQYLGKHLPFDKVKNFENLLTRVEYLRNVIKKMGAASTDNQLNSFLAQLDKNPIMLTNFANLTNVDPNNAQEVNSLLAFIKETLLAVYTKDYKVDNMVDKMGTLGGGNINKLSEEAGYSAAEPNKAFMKDANSRTTFKKNLTNFLNTAMGMFQYLHKSKGGNIARKDTSNKYTPPQRTAPKAQPQPQAGPTNQKTGQTSLFESENIQLMEEIKRIRKIMLG